MAGKGFSTGGLSFNRPRRFALFRAGLCEICVGCPTGNPGAQPNESATIELQIHPPSTDTE
jgi:hypothetical protein